jgi:hypothetical protein
VTARPPSTLEELLDQRALFQLVQTERVSRDAARWDELRACYWPGDSRVRVTWFDGTAEEFVERSREQAMRGIGHGNHTCVPISARVVGDRAIVESLGEIHVRAPLDGIEIDIDHWCRFVVRAQRREGEWRLRTFDAIYGKDRLRAVRPDERVHVDWSVAEPLRRSYRWLAYLNVRVGYPYDDALPGDDRPDLIAAFEADDDAWLAAAR